jgi:pimeloyl-ACP methyl ester carboxylesterase
MTTLCLVHGAFHGAWCWSKLTPELERHDLAWVAPDLPSADVAAGVSEYADVVVDALKEVDDEIVLVGHSMGGLTIPIVAARRTISHLVFLCGPVPTPGVSLMDETDVREERNNPSRQAVENEDGTLSWPLEPAIAVFYSDCGRDDAVWAASQLVAQALKPVLEPSPLERWPDTDSTYILCRDDRAFHPDSSRRISLERFGKPAIEIAGGHSPMISRPQELVDALLEVVRSVT